MSRAVLRHLPPAQPRWELDCDVVVAGSGAAGMSAALAAAAHGRRVLLLSKADLGGGATPLAQGGLAAAIGRGDDPALHLADTLAAGAGLCNPATVTELVSAAPGEIARLATLGARLEQDDLRREGGHSRHRIVHSGGDATGAEVHRVLTAALLASSVEILSGTVALDLLLSEDGRAGGLLAGMTRPGGGPLHPGVITARAVVIATGGFGQAYATTTSPAAVTGDGLALAARAGAELCDVEFVQFHPTVLWQAGARGQRSLITEALRGAGAVLLDAAGRPVMAGRHPLGDLAPRDVVSAAMYERMTSGDGHASHLWLDATALGRRMLEDGFPTVTAACRAGGIDPASEPIPVAPGAHYTCGGIRAGLDGLTSVPGLFAAGEVAATGVHGANRLASNSVTEALIAGRRTGELLGRELPARAGPLLPPAAGPGVSATARTELASAMSLHAGVSRDAAGLEELLATLAAAPPAPVASEPDLEALEAANLHTVSLLVAVAAQARAESRGCHRRSDAPAAAPGPARHSVLRWQHGRLERATGPVPWPSPPAAANDQDFGAVPATLTL